MNSRFAESVVEDAALAWFGELGFAVLHGPEIAPGELAAERTGFGEGLLPKRLRAALRKLNPTLPTEALDEAFRRVTVPQHPSLIANNRAFHRMLVDGIAVECRRKDDSIGAEIVRLVDFDDPDANDWLVVNQFTVIEGQHNRRPDVVLFVNGLPLGVIELKNAADEQTDIWAAFNQLQTYKQQIPSLFIHNAVLVISDGLETRIGTISADKERFMPWRTIEGETVAPASMPQLEVLLRGVFDKRRFLDLVRHFIVFEDDGGTSVIKKMAGYHQFHAVRTAIEETLRACGAASGDELKDKSGGYFARPQAGGAVGDRRVGGFGTRKVRANRSRWLSMPDGWCWNRRWRIRRLSCSPTGTTWTTNCSARSHVATNCCGRNLQRIESCSDRSTGPDRQLYRLKSKAGHTNSIGQLQRQQIVQFALSMFLKHAGVSLGDQ